MTLSGPSPILPNTSSNGEKQKSAGITGKGKSAAGQTFDAA
jgi:hypothetical protein